MIYIGCRLSVTAGYKAMGEMTNSFGGNTYDWFVRDPWGGKSKPLIPEQVEALFDHVKMKDSGPWWPRKLYLESMLFESGNQGKWI